MLLLLPLGGAVLQPPAISKVLYGGVPPSGGNEETRRWFEQALACDPRSPLHHLWLAKTLLQPKEEGPARENLEKCVHRAPVYWDDDLNQREAKRLLKKIK